MSTMTAHTAEGRDCVKFRLKGHGLELAVRRIPRTDGREWELWDVTIGRRLGAGPVLPGERFVGWMRSIRSASCRATCAEVRAATEVAWQRELAAVSR